MASSPYEFQINYEEKIQKEKIDNIYNETMNKLNNLFGEGIEFQNFISAKYEDNEAILDNIKKLHFIEEDKVSEKNELETKKRKKAIYELLKIYKKANCDKSLKFKLSPFKGLIEPIKIKMDGRILLNKQEN